MYIEFLLVSEIIPINVAVMQKI